MSGTSEVDEFRRAFDGVQVAQVTVGVSVADGAPRAGRQLATRKIVTAPQPAAGQTQEHCDDDAYGVNGDPLSPLRRKAMPAKAAEVDARARLNALKSSGGPR